MSVIYCVTWKGRFGFIKPYCAVRDELVFSQQFLTPSIVSGIEMKLFPELIEFKDDYDISKIKRHRLKYQTMSKQQEMIHSKGIDKKKRERYDKSILNRGVLINPRLTLGFHTREDAERALNQHIYLCRNEDILYPDGNVIEVSEVEFDSDKYNGYELIFGDFEDSIMVGFNRFKKGQPVYGSFKVFGDPNE